MRLTRTIVAAMFLVFAAIALASSVHAQCEPFEGSKLMDYDRSGFIDALDLNAQIDQLFFGGRASVIGVGDFNGDGAADALDLNDMIDLLFFGGPLPSVPRTVILKGRVGAGSWYLMNDPLVQYQVGDDAAGIFSIGEDGPYQELMQGDCDKTDSLYVPYGLHIQGSPSIANPSAFIVRRTGWCHMVGLPNDPVVLTSSFPVGQRARGDWGGMVINGCACNNNASNPLGAYVFETEGDGGIGGGEIEDDNSGCYRYLRVEFAGRQFFADNELNGITVTSVGNGTTMDHIQVNQNFDDGIEWFGGTVSVHHFIVSGIGDDGFDSDYGARWKGQYLIVVQDPITGPTSDNHNGFEWDNEATAPYQDAPRMKPTIWNATLVGADCNLVLARHDGAHIRRGADADIHNTVWTKFKSALEYDDPTAWDNQTWGPGCHDITAEANPDARIEIHSSIWYDCGNRSGNSTDANESPVLDDATNTLVIGCGNPEILNQVSDYGQVGSPLDFRPIPGDPQGIGINTAGDAPPADGFFDPAGANFKGALQENDPSPWYLGWTDFSID